MEKFNRFNDKIQELAGTVTSFLSLILVLLVSLDVIGRYAFNAGSVAAQELEWHIFAVIFLLAAGYTMKHEEHVKIDVLYTKFSPKKKLLVNIYGTVFLLFPFCLFILYYSIEFFIASLSIHEGSPDPGGLPARYLLKLMIPLGFLLLLMQGVSFLLTSITEYQNLKRGV
jgi:TRAP-type mannitol/chloroaromatic compound transport system permease small subunit